MGSMQTQLQGRRPPATDDQVFHPKAEGTTELRKWLFRHPIKSPAVRRYTQSPHSPSRRIWEKSTRPSRTGVQNKPAFHDEDRIRWHSSSQESALRSTDSSRRESKD